MISELFDEEYQREAYNRASYKKAMEMGIAEGKAERNREIAELLN